MWLTDDQQDLWRAYLAMSGRLQAALNRQLQHHHGLSLADYDVLVALSERPDCRMGELGAYLNWEQSRVSHQLARMRARGLIERAGAVDDRRAAVVTLSESGRDALEAAAPAHAELVRSVVFDGMSRTQATALRQWTAAVLGRLD
ncbi:MarR family transcriptional regulator [Mycobacterium sp. CBMA293]|uniref:MarR family winged helix-turn-helix transcriptional regulator n=1 Tax=unclassified Mycolicibacterium TaxID=2636767 RepID=UPI0012DC2BBE|nr:MULTISPECIES: MarR family winged helix-turn-helix transcriptional regulator [unclassified Mycolicibacterium]MUL47468.1 MarR family transcriptional regulator [Mycolicibacterium sp. CBMA 360]MUL59454.1 MarR family transcriptional regulator [Mycolicibacterium sp. CBMA 335]MUL71179.1 MarR family transcriptional regulator [Mycolicibacterium sp. CBMA 311]MUL94822.1 MarR family transcriptional regulator [Mycolicibacterium sp. CBMA 230]MUM11942.1 MarR family transcriptional regulator [Mycolicibacte